MSLLTLLHTSENIQEGISWLGFVPGERPKEKFRQYASGATAHTRRICNFFYFLFILENTGINIEIILTSN